jgi:hypothetical protein
MMKSGQAMGAMVLGGGILVLVVGLVFLGVLAATGTLTPAGLAVGVVFLLIVGLPVIGVGVWLTLRARQEGQEEEVAARQRRLLDMVATRGELRISDAAIELKATRDQIQGWVYNLVGLGLFNGYINWDDGVLYSASASQLKELQTCKKCGGKVSLAGKGVLKCQYCGTEYFL